MRWLTWLLLALAAPAAASPNPTDTTFTSAGVRIHYVESGSGEPVVLIHGWSADASMWDGIRAHLAPKYRVIALDCRGHGRSDKPHEASAYGIEMVNDVVRLLDHLGIQKANVVGYSMGGSIALKMLETHPERLLTVTSGASEGFRQGHDEPWDTLVVRELVAGVPLSQAMLDAAPPGMPPPSPEQRAMMKQMDARQDSRALGAQRVGNPGLYVDYAKLAKPHVPVLLLVGENDQPQRLDELRKTLWSDSLVVIPGARHGDATDHPEFAAALDSFLARH